MFDHFDENHVAADGRGRCVPVEDRGTTGVVPNDPERPESRLRSHMAMASGSGVPAAAPGLVLTGSLALCALVAVLTVVGVGVGVGVGGNACPLGYRRPVLAAHIGYRGTCGDCPRAFCCQISVGLGVVWEFSFGPVSHPTTGLGLNCREALQQKEASQNRFHSRHRAGGLPRRQADCIRAW